MSKPTPKPKKKITIDNVFLPQGADATRAPRFQPIAPRTVSAAPARGLSGRLDLPRKVLPSDQPHPTDVPANLGQLGDKVALAASLVPGGQIPAGAWMMGRGAAKGDPMEGLMGGLVAMSHIPASQLRELALGPMLNGSEELARVASASRPHAAEMARVYEGLPKVQPEAEAYYRQMAREVDDQFAQLEREGIKVEFTESDPYKSSAEMMADVRDSGRLKVFQTPSDHGHPFLTPAENDKFRAVHDYFGHFKGANQFGITGEENAYRAHSGMFSRDARRAMATETRGQNSWVNAGPNAHLPPGERPFAEQKGALWPEELTGEYKASPVARERRGLLPPVLGAAVGAGARAF